jgi:hypothetical protein
VKAFASTVGLSIGRSFKFLDPLPLFISISLLLLGISKWPIPDQWHYHSNEVSRIPNRNVTFGVFGTHQEDYDGRILAVDRLPL